MRLIGTFVVAASIIAGLYVGIWLCFIGGIVDVISQIRAEELSAVRVAIGIAKVMFTGVITLGICTAGTVTGMFIYEKK